MKLLILFYSYSGNTRRIAKLVQQETGGDLCEIETATPYTGSYNDVVDQGQWEVNSGFTPKLKPISADLKNYDTVILGTPVWWYTYAPAMRTLLQSSDCSGKVIYPFATNGGWLGAIGLTGAPAYIVAILISVAAGIIFGGLNGLMVTAGKIPPFIATLGAMKILRSVTQQFMQSSSPKVPTGFQQIARVKVGGQMFMPILYWLLIALVLYIVSKKTVFGRHVFAVGSNEKTSRLSGINVNRVKLGVYALMGAVVAIAAVLQVSRIGAMDPANAGSGYELDSIAAVIVGGTSMSGGKGSVVGTVFGMLIIAVMNNLLNLLGVPPFLREAFKGAIIIAAVLLQRKSSDN